MYPVIFDFGLIDIFGFQFNLVIYSFGLMLVIAFYTCYVLLDRDLKLLGYDEKLASDIIFWSAFGGIIGAKTYYLLENLDHVIASNDPIAMIFSGAGLVFLGGLAGSIFAVTIVLKKYNVQWLKFANLIAPLIFLGYAIGRIGCFLVGDDYGIPSNLPWAISFENGIPPTTINAFIIQYPWIDISKFEGDILRVHPTQLYETIICFFLFLILWKYRHNPSVEGKLFYLYLIFGGVERFFIEFLRTNEKYFMDIFSGAQIISIFMIFIGIYFLFISTIEEKTDSQ